MIEAWAASPLKPTFLSSSDRRAAEEAVSVAPQSDWLSSIR